MSRIASLGSSQIRLIQRISELGKAIEQNQQRLSTLRRINSAGDDPSGLIQASLLESQIQAAESLSKGIGRSQDLVNTAESAATQIGELIDQARTLALQAAGGGLTDSEIAANQIELDSILSGIETVSRVDFAGKRLLDGSHAARPVGANPDEINRVRVFNKTGDDYLVSVEIDQQATRASDSYTGGTLASEVTLSVTGSQGTASFTLASGSTISNIVDAFNDNTYLTGIEASVAGSNISFRSTGYGSEETIEIEAVSGTFTTTSGGSASGTDALVTINGKDFTGDGLTINASFPKSFLVIELDPSASGTLDAFTIRGEGLTFATNLNGGRGANLILPNLTIGGLGGTNGSLSELRSGQAFSLLEDPTAALEILDSAFSQVLTARAQLGSFSNYTLGSASRALDSTIEKTSETLSQIQDVDVATETALLTNNQLLMQSTIQTLQISRFAEEGLLSLLSQLTPR